MNRKNLLLSIILATLALTFIVNIFNPKLSYEINLSSKSSKNVASFSAESNLQTDLSERSNTIEPNKSITDESIKNLYEVAKSDIESSNRWFSTLLQIAGTIFTIFGLLIVIAAFIGFDKVREIDRRLASAFEKEKILDDHLSELNQPNPTPPNPIITENAQEPQSENKSPNNQPEDQNTIWIKNFHFERTYRLIFGSQLLLLKALKSSPTFSMGTPLLEAIHRRSKENDLDFQSYIGFLENSTLIGFNPSENSYYLTILGNEFLDYLAQNGIFDKPL